MKQFSDNLHRLVGMHNMTYRELAAMTDISFQTFSSWRRCTRSPSFRNALKVADFFEVGPHSLATEPFGKLLRESAGSPERFALVEIKIKRGRRGRTPK